MHDYVKVVIDLNASLIFLLNLFNRDSKPVWEQFDEVGIFLDFLKDSALAVTHYLMLCPNQNLVFHYKLEDTRNSVMLFLLTSFLQIE